MHNLDLPLASLLPQVQSWTRNNDGYVAHVQTNKGLTKYPVTEGDLETLDIRAPAIMQGLWKSEEFVNDGINDKYVSHFTFDTALSLEDKGFRVETSQRGEIYMRFVKFVDILPFAPLVQFTGCGYKMARTSLGKASNGNTVLYPVSSMSIVRVQLAFMEKTYPGWLNRYETAKLLGYEDIEAGAALFDTASSLTPAELPNMTMD